MLDMDVHARSVSQSFLLHDVTVCSILLHPLLLFVITATNFYSWTDSVVHCKLKEHSPAFTYFTLRNRCCQTVLIIIQLPYCNLLQTEMHHNLHQ